MHFGYAPRWPQNGDGPPDHCTHSTTKHAYLKQVVPVEDDGVARPEDLLVDLRRLEDGDGPPDHRTHSKTKHAYLKQVVPVEDDGVARPEDLLVDLGRLEDGDGPPGRGRGRRQARGRGRQQRGRPRSTSTTEAAQEEVRVGRGMHGVRRVYEDKGNVLLTALFVHL